MSDLGILVLLYGIGMAMLVAEIFIPSHGVLGVAGLGFLIGAIVKTFDYGGRNAGVVAILVCAVALPVFAALAIKYWHQTPIGRRISPPNPMISSEDTSIPVEEFTRLIGRTGTCTTPLRPVGICDFDGRRVSCIAEYGLIDAGAAVEATRIAGSNLAVREKQT